MLIIIVPILIIFALVVYFITKKDPVSAPKEEKPDPANSFGKQGGVFCYYNTPMGCKKNRGWSSFQDNGAATGWRVDPYATYENCLTVRPAQWQTTCNETVYTELATSNAGAMKQASAKGVGSDIL